MVDCSYPSCALRSAVCLSPPSRLEFCQKTVFELDLQYLLFPRPCPRFFLTIFSLELQIWDLSNHVRQFLKTNLTVYTQFIDLLYWGILISGGESRKSRPPPSRELCSDPCLLIIPYSILWNGLNKQQLQLWSKHLCIYLFFLFISINWFMYCFSFFVFP